MNEIDRWQLPKKVKWMKLGLIDFFCKLLDRPS